MKFSWGTGIAVFYGMFMLSMVGVVFASRRHDPGLVQKNYYDLDLNYQARLDKKQNTADLAAPPAVQFDAASKTIRVQFPDAMTAVAGTAKCYRSATTKDDFTVKLEKTGQLEIPAQNLAPGRWRIDLDWEAADGKGYFWETAVIIQ